MAEDTFSESWHRVATCRVKLRTSVDVRRQSFRGERWYVMRDPLNNQYFRIRPGAYEFIARLDGRRTVDEIWRECLESDPDDAPGQEEIVRLLGQMHHGNLVSSDMTPDAMRVFERYRKRRNKEIATRFKSILFLRIPLIDPDAFLKKTVPMVGWLIGPVGWMLWLLVVGFALKVGIERWDGLWNQAQSVLSPSNLPLLFVAMIGIKLLHELGHGYACRYYGGEVHTMGVMILVFSPLPYMDATSSWGFPSRWQRAAVASAGMIVEVFVAALAMAVWAATSPGAIQSIAYNMIFIAGVSTLLANANPLLRFDGYYILSDLLDMPNLHQRANRWWRHIFESKLFGYTRSKSPVNCTKDAWIVGIFGVLALIYRVILFAGILWFISGQFLILGMILAVVGVVTWVIVPTGKFLHYLATSPRLERVRPRAVGATLGLAAAVWILLATIPAPNWFTAPGVVRADGYTSIFAGAPGTLNEVIAESGTRVAKGDLLARLRNADLDIEWELTLARVDEAVAAEQAALDSPGGDLAAAREQLASSLAQKEYLSALRTSLEVRAPFDGLWVSPDLTGMIGYWMPRGSLIGELVGDGEFLFSAVVSQRDAAFLFAREVRASGLRLHGAAFEKLDVYQAVVIPADRDLLPSAVLGFAGGGDVAIGMQDGSGTRAAQTFFELRANILTEGHEALMMHGRSGRLRCRLPPEPLAYQWIRKLRQLFQQRIG